MQSLTNTTTVFICRPLLLHLPNTYAEFYYCTYRIYMQGLTSTTTVFVFRPLLLNLPNTYAELSCYTYLLGKAMSIIVFK